MIASPVTTAEEETIQEPAPDTVPNNEKPTLPPEPDPVLINSTEEMELAKAALADTIIKTATVLRLLSHKAKPEDVAEAATAAADTLTITLTVLMELGDER